LVVTMGAALGGEVALAGGPWIVSGAVVAADVVAADVVDVGAVDVVVDAVVVDVVVVDVVAELMATWPAVVEPPLAMETRSPPPSRRASLVTTMAVAPRANTPVARVARTALRRRCN
jgi:hypothetical protein